MLIDAHVHFHAVFDANRFLDAAVRNFQTARKYLHLSPEIKGCLFLTEGKNENAFQRLKELKQTNDWIITSTRESESLIATCHLEQIYLIAGRQIVTKEDVEVLSLGSSKEIQEQRPISETLESVIEAGGFPVLPWGFGKWWGRRGDLIRTIIENTHHHPIGIADNHSRLRTFTPALFKEAIQKRIPILSGSDPLPFVHEEEKAGINGTLLEGEIDPDKPGEGLKEILRSLRSQPRQYGKGESILPFLSNQLRMQLKKRGL